MVQLENFEEQKREIELSLARILLTQLQKKTITFEECQEIAKYILEGIPVVGNSEELLEFLKIISQQFSIFETTYGFYKCRIDDDKKLLAKRTKEMFQELEILSTRL